MLFGGDGTLFPMITQYYSIVLFSIFFVIISEPMAAAMRTDGLPLISGVALLLPHILNAVLDVLFINVCGWGLAGAALATVLGYLAGFLLCCYYFFFRKSYRLSFGETREKRDGRPAETGQIDNIAMLRAVSHKIEYTRVMGLNKTDITLQ